MAEPVAGPSRALSLSGVCTREVIPRGLGPRGEHRARGAEKATSLEGSRLSVEVPGLTQANLQRLEGKDPVPAALASVVSSLPPSESSPTPHFEEMAKVANTKVKGCRRAARKGKGKETAMMGPMFGTTWGEEFEIPYGECAASASAHSSEWEPDWISREPTPTKEPVCMGRKPSPRAPEPVCVERSLPPRMAAPKLGLDETMELVSRVLRAGEEDPDLSALSAALKANQGLSDLKKPPPTLSRGVELLTRDVKSCRGIRSSPMDTCPSPFHPRVRTLPVCSVGDTTEAEMKGYGLVTRSRGGPGHGTLR